MSHQKIKITKNPINQNLATKVFHSVDFCRLTSFNMKLTQAGHLYLHLDFGIEDFAEEVEYGFINQGNFYVAVTKDSLSSIVYG